MLSKIYNRIDRLSRARFIWTLGLLSLLFLLLFNVVMLPEQLAKLLGYNGPQRLFLLDITFGYTPDWVYSVLTAYGANGRAAYIVMSLIFDFAFPVIYSLFLATTLNATLSRLLAAQSVWRKLVFVALLTGLADCLENLAVLGLLLSYPQKLDWLAATANFFTIAKDSLLGLTVLILLVALGILLYRKLTGKNRVSVN